MRKVVLFIIFLGLGVGLYLLFNSANSKTLNKEYVHEFFKINSNNTLKFNGILYDKNLNEYSIINLLEEDSLSLKNRYSKYFFTKNISEEEEKLNCESYTNPKDLDVEYLVNILGNPSTIYEKYELKNYNGVEKNSGQASLIYNFDNYIVEVLLWDFRKWPDKKFNKLSYYGINVYDFEYFKQNAEKNYKDYECYGEKFF